MGSTREAYGEEMRPWQRGSERQHELNSENEVPSDGLGSEPHGEHRQHSQGGQLGKASEQEQSAEINTQQARSACRGQGRLEEALSPKEGAKGPLRGTIPTSLEKRFRYPNHITETLRFGATLESHTKHNRCVQN